MSLAPHRMLFVSLLLCPTLTRVSSALWHCHLSEHSCCRYNVVGQAELRCHFFAGFSSHIEDISLCSKPPSFFPIAFCLLCSVVRVAHHTTASPLLPSEINLQSPEQGLASSANGERPAETIRLLLLLPSNAFKRATLSATLSNALGFTRGTCHIARVQQTRFVFCQDISSSGE